MDEVYLREVIKEKVNRTVLITGIVIIIIIIKLMEAASISIWWSLLLLIPIMWLMSVTETSLRDIIYKRRKFHDDPFIELDGDQTGKVGQRARLINRVMWIFSGTIIISIVIFLVLKYVMQLDGRPFIASIFFVMMLEPWVRDPIQRLLCKRRGLTKLFVEKPEDVASSPSPF
jgi:hypothetical protein